MKYWLSITLMFLYSWTIGHGQCDPISPSLLYAPAVDDNPAFRAEIAAETGGVVDYINTADMTPTLADLQDYCAVYTWVNDGYDDAEAFGDVLADYVDGGGKVILGSFVTFPVGDGLEGRIMSVGYSPVVSTTESNTGNTSIYANDGTSDLYEDITALSSDFQDELVLQGSGIADGTFENGEILAAYRPDFNVIYLNGSGDPEEVGTMGDWPKFFANAVSFGVVIPTGPVVPSIGQWEAFILMMCLSIIGLVYLFNYRLADQKNK